VAGVEVVGNIAMEAVDDEVLEDLYTWVDEIPLSRPKRNITRDFSDGGKILGCLI
jgi:hypothetical protein